MKTRFLARLTAFGAAAALCGTALGGVRGAAAARETWKFDFGGAGTAEGYTGVSASVSYSTELGYGFSPGTAVSDVSASGSGALSDAVRFTNATPSGGYTFCADVPAGLYEIKVTLGDTERTSVAAEGMYQLMNLTGDGATDTFRIPITDGTLNLCVCAGKEGYAFTLSALEITKISDQTQTDPTIWICGDSTVCNYYPRETSAQAGWGQLLPEYLTGDWDVRNMAASGQYAKGFVDAGQFEPVKAYGKAGDIYVISIGINDTNYSNAEEYYNVVSEMAKTASDLGMRVILVKQQGRNGDAQRSPLLTGRWFGGQLDQIGEEQGLQVVDLFTLWQNYCIEIGAEQTNALYMPGDTLHPCRAGAEVLARFMAEAIESGQPADFPDGTYVMFENAATGQTLSVPDAANAQNGSSAGPGLSAGLTPENVWRLEDAGDGNYRIYSMLSGGERFLLDVYEGKPADGTAIGVWENTDSDAQVFRLLKNGDRYALATAVSGFESAVKLTESGAQEWASDGSEETLWNVREVTYNPREPLLPGDLDGDGALTAKDYTLLARGAAAENAVRASDLNEDFAVTQDDSALLGNLLTGRENALPDAVFLAAQQSFAGGMTESVNEGFSLDAYLNLDNAKESLMTFAVRVPKAGNYLCTFRVANASANDRAVMIRVNAQADRWRQSFLTTGAWTNWEERAIVLPLDAGVNRITLLSDTDEGAPNLDTLRLTFTDEPVAEPYVPDSQPQGPDDAGKVLYIASDSTAQSYRESYAPQQGWGYYLGEYLPETVTVSNHAIAGRSSKSFYDNGRLDTILEQIKAGDFLLVCFGINDGAASQPERYAPVCGDAQNPAEGSFEFYMTKYIEGALAKDATPILMSPTLSIKNASQPFSAGYRNIDSACLALAQKYDIPYFDLGDAMARGFNELPYDTVYGYYMGSVTEGGTDFTHFTQDGASAVARIIADGITPYLN